MSTKGEYCRIFFRVVANLEFGQCIGVGGNNAALGHYDKDKVIQLVTTADSFPIWYSLEPIVIRREEEVLYNYCIIENGAFKQFEAMHDPRVLIATQTDVVVEDEIVLDAQSEVLPQSRSQTYSVDVMDIDDFIREEEKSKSSYDKAKSYSESFSATPAPNMIASYDINTIWKQKSFFMICYHLPVRVQRVSNQFQVKWDDSLISKNDEEDVMLFKTKFWIGTVTVPGDKLTNEEELELTEILLNMNCIPIYLDQELISKSYCGYCKKILWPTFHNIEQLDYAHESYNNVHTSSKNVRDISGGSDEQKTIDPEKHLRMKWNTDVIEDWYEAFKLVTVAFAIKLGTLLGPEDTVWVHDYHLMLLPGMLRPAHATIKIVFFFHVPFPTSQIFRSLPTAITLMRSIVEADVVGFHAFDYARHFAQSTKRLLGYSSHSLQGGLFAIQTPRHEIIISMAHVSINPIYLNSNLADPEASQETTRLAAKYINKKVISTVQTCQRLSGTYSILMSYKMFLSELEASERLKYMLVVKVVLAGTRVEDEKQTASELRAMALHINQKYGDGNMLVDYEEYESISVVKRVALWLVSDVYVNSSLREGLNLIPLEYMYCRRNLPNTGIVILSEFSACASVLNGSIKINPFNTRHVSEVFGKVLNMPASECNSRTMRDMHFVCNRNTNQWMRHILNDLLSQISINIIKLKNAHRKTLEIGTLDIKNVIDSYSIVKKKFNLKPAGNRLLIFDYGGTILTKERFGIYVKQSLNAIAGRKPSQAVLDALKKLSDDPNNIVVVITGLTRNSLGDVFDLMPNITLACSNGMWHSWSPVLRDVYDPSNTPVANADLESDTDISANDCMDSVSSGAASDDDLANERFSEISQVQNTRKSNSSQRSFFRKSLSVTTTTTSDQVISKVVSTSFDGADEVKLIGQQCASSTSSPERRMSNDDSFDHQYVRALPPAEPARQSQRSTASLVDRFKRYESQELQNRRWDILRDNVTWSDLKAKILPILNKFTNRVNGSTITPREPGLAWSFFAAEPDYAEKMAERLRFELEAVLVNFDVKIVTEIKGTLEIVPQLLHKGLFVNTVIERVRALRAGKLPTFCMIAGDEPTDDTMFEAMYQSIAHSGPQDVDSNSSFFTVHVGRSAEHKAGAYVDTVEDLEDILTTLSKL